MLAWTTDERWYAYTIDDDVLCNNDHNNVLCNNDHIAFRLVRPCAHIVMRILLTTCLAI